MIELGRIDMITEFSLLSSFIASPRHGHLEAVFHIFAYLDKKHKAWMAFDPTYPDIDMSVFKTCECKEFYRQAKFTVPPDAPPTLGKEVDICLYMDSDHTGNKATRSSHTDYSIFLNSALIIWFSKRQPTVKTSVFGAEFVAMKNGTEAFRGLCYKLKMMGVPLSGPSFAFGDNLLVIYNPQQPESVL